MGEKRILNLGHFNFPWHDYMIGAIGHVVLMVVGYGVSLAGRAEPATQSRAAVITVAVPPGDGG